MQLSAPASSLRARLRAATCVLLAIGAPVSARAGDAAPAWQFDITGLAYAEKARTSIFEPIARITRQFAGGQSLSAQVTLDAMSGASPSGAQPSGQVVTTTSASGVTQTSAANQVPTKPFSDFRGAYSLDWVQPMGFFTLSAGGNFSRERDYRSVGWHGQGALDLDRRLMTLSFGGGVNRDEIFPVGGMHAGLGDGIALLTPAPGRKTVTEGLLGLSRVLTRRWLLGVTGSRVREEGYLTEPYKVVSVIDTSGLPVVGGELTEKRPEVRNRNSVLASSVYHLPTNLAYGSYRYYRDDWGVRSHTVDLKFRVELPQSDWLQPHVRHYSQTAADFFVFGLRSGAPLPPFATSDFRLGPLHSVTLGLTYGCPVPNSPGEFTVRGEYMRQWGDGHPADAVGAQRDLDLFPPLDTFMLVAGYSVGF